MPSYQIHRLKDHLRQQFRWAPHTSGVSTVKPRDYENDAPVQALTVYAAWEQLRGSDRPLQVGDILEDESGGLHICKYIGFEEARWFVAVAAEPAPLSVPVSQDA
jgi:hypothetical protein